MDAAPVIPVALVEDLPALRASLIERLRLSGRVEVVLAAGSGEAFLAALPTAPVRPRLVLMDLGLPGLSGAETTARLRAADPDLPVLVLTVFEDDEQILAAVQAGATGYLLKDTPTDRLVAAIEELLAGGAPLSPIVARKLLRLAAETPLPSRPAGPAVTLTDREREILQHVVEGDTEARIAELLFISPHTVRSHLVHIYGKLQVNSRAGAVREAFRHRLV